MSAVHGALHADRRSPHGERGLKFRAYRNGQNCNWSLPSRGAWIEMVLSLLMLVFSDPSLPSRGAWIEMAKPSMVGLWTGVAPLTGSVDYNYGVGR